MAGVWSSVLTLDLVIPSNGALSPGSNTFYIGGPRIPADLKADGALSALIWYSNADGLAAGVDYWYIAHLRLGSQQDLLQAGYKPTGSTRRALWGGWIEASGKEYATFEAYNTLNLEATTEDVNVTSVLHDIVVTAARAIFIEADYTGPGALQLIAPNGSVAMGKASGIPGSNLQFAGFNTSRVQMRAYNTDQDKWNSSTTSQTIGGVANCTVLLNWRFTADYILDVRYFVTFPVAPGAAANMSFTLPGSFPTTDLAPLTTRGAYGLCLSQAGGTLVNMITRIDPGIIYVFTNGVLNIATWEASITLSIPKP